MKATRSAKDRKGTGFVTKDQLRALMMQDYDDGDEESDEDEKDDAEFEREQIKYQERTQRGATACRASSACPGMT